MQDVFSHDSFGPDPGFRKGNVLWDGFVKVVAVHEHVEMLIHGVFGERARWVGRAGDYIWLLADL